MADVRIHPTALIEPGVVIGPGTSVWDHVHVRGPATIGRDCIVGEKTYVAYGVAIGDGVKVNAHVYLCTGVTIESRVMIAAGVIFTNDRYPRAFDPDSGALASSAPTADTLHTVVREGATLGAGARLGPGIEIGRYAMVGMGAVVLRDVPPYGLVVGNPARLRGFVCVCGTPLDGVSLAAASVSCGRCGRRFEISESRAGGALGVAVREGGAA
ncbi:MAG: acyltransferase [Deltaproteobacteria bacterium]|nr:acyltransferase [Deltaproteobacteria bacterium]